MSDRPAWFAAKRYGVGSGRPIAWQGWLVLGAFTALIFASVILLGGMPLALFSVVVPVTALLLVICAKTTRGGWRWRWGEME